MTTFTEDAAALLAQLVAIPSVNPAFRTVSDPAEHFGEAGKATAIASWLTDAGLATETVEALPGRPNVIARVKGTSGGPRLIIECHTDTVQVTGMEAPFTPVLRDGRLYGRGAVDDGGCIVAMMLAMRALHAAPPPGDVTFVAAIDEEQTFLGVQHLLAQGETADGGIAGEPTNLRVVTASKGCARWHIDVLGRAAHSSAPQNGIDAIAGAAELLAYLRAEVMPGIQALSHPLAGAAAMTCTLIEGGQGVNTVAERCRLTFDRRTLPGEEGVDTWQAVVTAVETFAARRTDGLRVICQPLFIDAPSMDVPTDQAVVRAMQAVCAEEGVEPAPLGVGFGSDASSMTKGGIPTIVFGPGDIAQAHAAVEFVDVAEVAQAARMIEAMARRFGAMRGA